jgi:hypothetical protein
LFLEVVVLVVGLESLQEVRWLGILPLEFTTGMGGVVALRRRGGMVHGLSFVVLVLLQAERVGSLRVVRRDGLVCANPTFEKMARHWFYSFGTNPVLSRLFTHVLIFEVQVGDLKNIWLKTPVARGI